MKVTVLLAYAVLTTRGVAGAAIRAPLDIISLDDITEGDRGALRFVDQYYHYPPRGKRSGEDALNSIKAAIGQGIKSKLSLLAKGSAAASSKLSSSSSSKGHSFHDAPPEHHPHKSFDFWSLKKSILNTLLQAVKAIKGGVIAIKGQLIKGSGYLISAKGKLISSKGESITNLGKNIATSAVLSPTHGHSEGYSHGDYHHSAPEEYGSPSAPGPEYQAPEHHYHHHEDKPDGGPSGILILKKIPAHDDHHHAEHKVPDFKPIEHTGPSFGEIIGKFFSASTSLKPGYPLPFGDEHAHHSDHHHEEHHESHHVPAPSHGDYHESHSSHGEFHHAPQSSHGDYHHAPQSSHGDYHHVPHSSHSDSHHEYPASSHEHFKSPASFEQAPDFLNLAEYASESKRVPQSVVKLPEIQTTPEAQQLQVASSLGFETIQPYTGYDTSLTLDSPIPNLFDVSLSGKPTSAFPLAPPGTISLPSVQPTQLLTDFSTSQFGAFPSLSADTEIKYLAPPPEAPSGIFPRQNSDVNTQSPYPQSVKDHAFLDTAQSAVMKELAKRPTRSKNNSSTYPIFIKNPYVDNAQSEVALLEPEVPKESLKRPTRNKNNTYSGYPQSVKQHSYMDSLRAEVLKELMKTPSITGLRRPPRRNPPYSKSPRPQKPLRHYSHFPKTLHQGPDRPKRT